MHVLQALLPLSLAGGAFSAAISPRNNDGGGGGGSAISCHDLWEKAPQILPDLEVYYAGDYEAGTNFTTEYATVAYPDAVPDLAAFCRFGAWIHTPGDNRVQFEVWLPKPEEWSGRFAMVGNGGDAGGVNFPDMGVPLTKYHYAVASTDTGHHGVSGNGTFAANNPESQNNFGYRAVHLTTVYSKAIVKAYYGKPQDYSYWIGCSSGGKQGLREIQLYPEEYDGVLAGAAAQYWTRLSAQIYRLNTYINGNLSTSFLNRDNYDTIAQHVLAACDGEDGVEDGIITDPSRCRPDLTPLLCSSSAPSPSVNETTCLSEAQIANMNQIWAQWSWPNGTYLYEGMSVGAEALSDFSVVNNTEIGAPYAPTEQEFYDHIQEGLDNNPGGINAVEPNIEPFLKRGKLLTFHGWSDRIIPSRSSIRYFDEVHDALGKKDLSDSYRLFMVPGMGHCRSGPGAWNFGANGQRPLSLKGAGQSSVFDEDHDMLLALQRWVEKGEAPEVIIGTKYNNDNKNEGVNFTRKLCPHPMQGVYVSGDENSADSFACRYV
ncbi:hypothetical protein JCM8547_002395 [Rhodosporidiobolus lusitaniae]